MRTAFRFRLVVVVLSGLSAIAWACATLRAQGPAPRAIRPVGAFGGDKAEEPEPPVPTVHLAMPVTAQAAKTWLKLQEPIRMNFPDETPLEDVLKYIKEATRGKEERGIPIFVDPIGLQEAEKPMTSPVTLDLEGIPLATSLKLLLKQLGLRYYVQEDGILMIVYQDDEDSPADPPAKVLNDLSALRKEVDALRRELGLARGRLRNGAPPSQPSGNPRENPGSGTTKKTTFKRYAQFGGMGSVDPEFPEKSQSLAAVRLASPLSEKAARTWLKLQESVALYFVNETPLEDVLKYIRSETKDKDGTVLSIYVDPVGLQEAEKMMTSPITFDLEGVPLTTSLTLMLKQLALTWHVQEDGILVITSEFKDTPADPSARALDKIAALRVEVAELRRALSVRRGGGY